MSVSNAVNSEMVQGFKYEFRVCQTVEEFNKRSGKLVIEIFIPSIKMICTQEGDFVLHATKARKPDDQLTEVQVPKALVDRIVEVTKLQLKAKEELEKLTSDFNNFCITNDSKSFG